MVTFKALSIAGLGVLGAGAVSVGGYAAISSGGTGSPAEEQVAAKVQRLLGNDYTFNPPKFTSYEKLIQGCHENLSKSKHIIFKEDEDEESEDVEEEVEVGDYENEGFKYSELYGCGVAKMDLWESGDQFGNKKVNYLTFGSEIFLRKGQEGWRINTLIDNHTSGKLIYRHLISFLDQQPNGNWWTIEAFLFDEKVAESDQEALESLEIENQQKLAVTVGNKELNIKLPGTTGSWFKDANYLINGPAKTDIPLTKNHKVTKEWSGIWINDSKESSQKIFQDIGIFIGDEENEQVFCKKRNSCGAGIGSNYKISYQGTNKSAPNTWDQAYTTLTDNKNSGGDWSLRYGTGPTIPISELVDKSKGKWSESKEICNTKNTEINVEELRKLKAFCSKSKK